MLDVGDRLALPIESTPPDGVSRLKRSSEMDASGESTVVQQWAAPWIISGAPATKRNAAREDTQRRGWSACPIGFLNWLYELGLALPPAFGSLLRFVCRDLTSRCSVSNWASTAPIRELFSSGCFVLPPGTEGLPRTWPAMASKRLCIRLTSPANSACCWLASLLLVVKSFGQFSRAAAHCIQLGFQRRALLEPLGLMLLGVLDEVANL